MTITEADIKLLESQRMTDADDGGGRMTLNEIPDGVTGNVWPRISRVDSVNGRLNLRKLFLAIRTATLDLAGGAHSIVGSAPADERVHVVLFDTPGSEFDDRTEARNRIESYVVRGPQSRMVLYGTQFTGQSSITVYQRPSEPLPDIGSVYVLSIEDPAYTEQEQYVRVADIISNQERQFVTGLSGSGEVTITRRVLTLKLDSILRHDFPGPEEVVAGQNHGSPTVVRETTVQDAARYFGVQPLAEAASAAAVSARVASIFSPIVPTSTRETALSQVTPAGAGPALAAGAARVIRSGLLNTTGTLTYYSATPIKPGSVEIINLWTEFSSGDKRAVDDGAGLIVQTSWNGSGGDTGSAILTGTVDYSTGRIDLVGLGYNTNLDRADDVTITVTPGLELLIPAHTHAIAITLSNRGTVYVHDLIPTPAPGTVIVDYRAQGRWYRLRDDGAGKLEGAEASIGVGTVDYATGGLTVTLGALPDVDSSILIAWGSPIHFTVRAGDPDIDTALRVRHSLGEAVNPGTLSLSWLSGGVAKSASAAATGTISGDCTGHVSHAVGELRIEFVAPPDAGTKIGIDYEQSTLVQKQLTGVTESGGVAAISVGEALEAGSLELRWSTTSTSKYDGSETTLSWVPDEEGEEGDYKVEESTQTLSYGSATRYNHVAFDDGVGGLTHDAAGVVNYANGDITLPVEPPVTESTWNQSTNEWETQTSTTDQFTTGIVDAWYIPAGQTPVPVSIEIDPPALQIRILPRLIDEYVVPGSVLFSWNGETYVDRQGLLVRAVDPLTGAGTEAGSINYLSGIVTLTDYVGGAGAVSVLALLATFGEFTAGAAQFRTAGSPVRPGSGAVLATTETGDQVIATSDETGALTGAGITSGQINQSMGVVTIEWDAPVFANTIRYSAVVVSSVPLDADIVGVDSVRLPIDGRVPVFRVGDTAVFFDEQILEEATPIASEVIDCGRTGVTRIDVRDANGIRLASDRYAPDLAAGTVELAADFVPDDHDLPLQIAHRVEDMVQISDVQINGEIAFSPALGHDYPQNARVSSALLHGDLQASATEPFDQGSWTGEWSDTLIGSESAAQYNSIDYPIEVLNNGAVTERWRLNFTSARTTPTDGVVQVIGETLGILGSYTLDADLAPVNPLTGQPYFVVRLAGFGIGWSVGNQIRYNTKGAQAGIWAARVVLQGASIAGDSSARIEARVDTGEGE